MWTCSGYPFILPCKIWTDWKVITVQLTMRITYARYDGKIYFRVITIEVIEVILLAMSYQNDVSSYPLHNQSGKHLFCCLLFPSFVISLWHLWKLHRAPYIHRILGSLQINGNHYSRNLLGRFGRMSVNATQIMAAYFCNGVTNGIRYSYITKFYMYKLVQPENIEKY